MPEAPVVPRPAATLIVVRDAAAGIEVLLVRRTSKASFVPGAIVFPGGAIGSEDASAEMAALCMPAASALQSEELAARIAAIRECFEEAGVLLADTTAGELLAITEEADVRAYAALRDELNAGRLDFARFCAERGLRPAIERLVYFSRWITPAGSPIRFDAHFFVAVAPPRQTSSHDERETVEHLWLDPAEALERQQRGEFEMRNATMGNLRAISGFANTDALMEHARRPRTITPVLPRYAMEAGKPRVLLPDHRAYAEVVRLDPLGEGTVSCELVPDVITRLSPVLRRLTAPNATYMTGPGTNTYLLGAGDEVALIDPGPLRPEHVAAILREAGARIRWILVTHTHPDHSPGVALLRAQCEAQLIGMPPPPHERQDQTFKPDYVPTHGERLTVAGCTLRVVHTPGHASNHLCYLLQAEKLLFTGDHIMQGSTVVINPPDGDMAAYLDSLRLLLREDIEWLAPGHGFLMDRPHAVVERLLAHRAQREAKVCDALAKLGRASVDTLLPMVYADVPAGIHPVAARSLLAHLIKLEAEGRVQADAERLVWSLTWR